MQAHAAGARLPTLAGVVGAQPGEFLPGLRAVDRTEQRGILDTGVHGVRIGQRRFEVPDPGETPGPRRPVVPLVWTDLALVAELVALWFPGQAAVVGSLDHLTEPAAGRCGVEPIRIGRRTRQVVGLPSGEMRTADIPVLAVAIGGQDERSLAGPDQHSYTTHRALLFRATLEQHPTTRRPRPQGRVVVLACPGWTRVRADSERSAVS